MGDDGAVEMDPSGACRLCDESAAKMVGVFERTEGGKCVAELVKEFLPIFIFKSDPHSKQICADCLNTLENMDRFKSITKEVNDKNKLKAGNNAVGKKQQQQHLQENNGIMDTDDSFALVDVSTGTEDLPVLCVGCKQAVIDASTINGEVELNGDLQKVVVDVLNKQRKQHLDAALDKGLRNRRKKPQPFYHELDDSICSSMTEFTQNTEEECSRFEDGSDGESVGSEDLRKGKRRRESDEEVVPEKKTKISEDSPKPKEVVFEQEVEYKYYPFSLLQLALNGINGRLVPDYTPDDFLVKEIQPQCRYCRRKFQNTKILALHEVSHMDVVVEDKIDNPAPWPETRKDSSIRNKWLTYFDEHGYEEEDLVVEPSLLIPIEMTEDREEEGEEEEHGDLVTLQGAKPVVKGIPLQEFTKEERKNFYQTLTVGGVKKRFCQICRYIFKDNWAIESHYFSSACYYTCKYCGMRFNKQRQKYEEHMAEHLERNDTPITDKFYAPSKINNFMPKIIHPDAKNRLRPAIQEEDEDEEEEVDRKPLEEEPPVNPALQEIKSRFSKKPAGPKDKQALATDGKGNQAFFCRKCYKVFFKLDEFNVHSKKCNFNQPPLYANVRLPTGNANNSPKNSPAQQKNGESTPTPPRMNRPTRNCARDVGPYKDEAYIPEVLLKEQPAPPPQRQTIMAGPPFICFICNTPFPTVYSRNSHMRIHKGEASTGNKAQPRPNHYLSNNQQQQHNNYNKEPYIKQEPLEPEVQIHEREEPVPQVPQMIGGGAVSITPIPKKNNQRMTINPDIYKLVQDNPNISLKRTPDKPQTQPSGSQVLMVGGSPAEDKSYKCSSCWEPFSNKSHLYFHKKNQCEGSRFPCPFCKKRFGTEAAYSSHIFYSHPE